MPEPLRKPERVAIGDAMMDGYIVTDAVLDVIAALLDCVPEAAQGACTFSRDAIAPILASCLGGRADGTCGYDGGDADVSSTNSDTSDHPSV
jgi:hypothetical protein